MTKTKIEHSTKDYNLLPDIIHKQDLWNAKLEWRKQIQEQGLSKKQYKWQRIAKFS